MFCLRTSTQNLTARNGFFRVFDKIHKNMFTASATSVVDLRSDTLTKPTGKMREAMSDAIVGDDVYGEDPTVNKLQETCANLLGKEASLLMPTCTMANTTSVLVHCQGRFNEILLGDMSHMHLYEVAGMAQLGGVQGRCVSTLPDGTLDLNDLEDKIRPLNDDHQPWTKMVCLENTHNKCGGKVLSLEYIKRMQDVCKKNKLIFHLDGARLFNAAAASNVEPSEIAQYFDSVSTAFSKGLCCPVGSILAGSKEFIAMAKRARKALGGGMRQAGVIAAPMLVALEEMISRLGDDHQRAKNIAQGLNAMTNNPVCSIDMDGVKSNIVMIDMIGDVSPEDFACRMQQVTESEKSHLGESISVLMLPFSKSTVRYVTHNDVTDEGVDKAVKKLQYVIDELSS